LEPKSSISIGYDDIHKWAITVVAGLNGYGGFTEAKSGLALALAPSGVSQVVGVYMMADGTFRMASAPIQIYGAWAGNKMAENWPTNILGFIGMIADAANQLGDANSAGPFQKWLEITGDFAVSKQNLIQKADDLMRSPGFINGINTAKEIVSPYYKAFKEAIDSKDN
jgi:hypothetical protein